ncbi:hypothetical protein K438DRAFT_1819416 [Mycena galopus ATCC 62051]|nr:hypothetical protein K438DRAFT_1819416 [Mycena galopus ATCC 62051]
MSISQSTYSRSQIGFVGLGGMGGMIAKNLANHRAANVPGSLPLLVLLEELGQQKVTVATTLEQVVTECDIIITSLANDETVKSVYEQFQMPPARTKIFVEASTVVFGTPIVAAAAQLLIVMSGHYESKKEVAHILLIGNSMILGTMEVLAEAYTLAEKAGIPASEVHGFIIFTSPRLVRYSERMSTNNFDATNGFSVDGGIKTLPPRPMRSIDIAHEHLVAARGIYAAQVQAGKGTVEVLDWSGLIAGARTAAG